MFDEGTGMGHGRVLRYTYMYKYTHEVFSLCYVTSLLDRPLTVAITMGQQGMLNINVIT